MNTRLTGRRSLLLSLPLLAGCSLLPTPRSARIYRLSPMMADPPGDPIPRIRLAVDLPNASQSLDTGRIALLQDQTRLDYYADSVWTDRLPVLLQTLIIEAFETDGRIVDVSRNSRAVPHGYLLRTDIRQFQADYSSADMQLPDIVVALHLQLTAGLDDRFVGGRSISVHGHPLRNRLSTIVAAFNVASAAALAEIVAWTAESIATDRRAHSHPARRSSLG